MLAKASKNRALELISSLTFGLIYGQIIDRYLPLDRYLAIGDVECITKMHREIFEAVRQRDPQAARAKMVKDMQHNAEMLELYESANLNNSAEAGSGL